MQKLQSGDKVIIIAWKHKGDVSTIEKTHTNGTVTVAGVNVYKKAVKGQWHVEVTLPIRSSNVAHYDEKSKKATRVWIKTEKGKTVRYLKSSGKILLPSKS